MKWDLSGIRSAVSKLDRTITQTLAISAVIFGLAAILFPAHIFIAQSLSRKTFGLYSFGVFRDAILTGIVCSACWVCLTPLIAVFARRLKKSGIGRLRWSALHFLFSLPLCFLVALVTLVTHTYAALSVTSVSLHSFSIVFFQELYDSIWMYWTIVAVYSAVSYYHEVQAARIRESALNASLAQSELENLRVQLQPHFLFNTLNTISALVRDDPDAAEDMIGDLSDLLRESLQTRSVELVPLMHELSTLDRYLSIQKTRFSDRLNIQRTIMPETMSARVPHLLLQPLVENAIRHGIAKRSRLGTLWIDAITDGINLTMRVGDDGPGATLPVHEGVGLSNTRARLTQLYGSEFKLSIEAGENGFAVTVRVPLQIHEGVLQLAEATA